MKMTGIGEHAPAQRLHTLFGFMGCFKGPDISMGAPDGPVVRVTGFAFWGGVEVKRVRVV